jgi:hypothetical protein
MMFPFTRAEFLSAQLLVLSPEAAETATSRVYEPDPEVIGITVMDGTVVLLALVSDDLAERVIEYRPHLKGMVEAFTARRAEVLAQLRQTYGGDDSQR